MRRAALGALLALAAAQPAAALSCLPVTATGVYAEAAASEANYAVALGRLALEPGETIPSTGDDPTDRQGYTVRARFEGALAQAGGFDQPAAFPLEVRVECAGLWCGAVPLMDRMIAFIELRGDGEPPLLVQGPCPFHVLPATAETVAQIEGCLRGEACSAP